MFVTPKLTNALFVMINYIATTNSPFVNKKNRTVLFVSVFVNLLFVSVFVILRTPNKHCNEQVLRTTNVKTLFVSTKTRYFE